MNKKPYVPPVVEIGDDTVTPAMVVLGPAVYLLMVTVATVAVAALAVFAAWAYPEL